MNPPSERDITERSRVSLVSDSTTSHREDFQRRLTDEYKILQDKIDKIGAFRFTIKGWSVTAVIAASAAGGAANSSRTMLTISVGLAAMVIFFFLLEFEQVKLSRLFGRRAMRLESAFARVDRGSKNAYTARFPVPHTATEIAMGHRRGRTSLVEQTWLPERWADQCRVVRSAHIWFYVVLLCLAFAPLWLHSGETGKSGEQARKEANLPSGKAPIGAAVGK